MRRRMRSLSLVVIASAAVAADPLTLVLPQTVHQPVGATTALRGGATYALGSEAAATWYNPAMAASIDPEQLSAGATAYGFNSITVSAGRDSDALLSGAVLKVYGGLSGRSAEGDWGWTAMLCNPMHWRGAVDSGRAEPTASERSYATQVRVNQDTWSAQLALGWTPLEGVQLGGALVGNYDIVDLIQSVWTRDFQGRYAADSFTASGWNASMQLKLGAAVQPAANLSVGLCLVTPGIELLKGGMTNAAGATVDPLAGTSSSFDARVEADAFRFVHAWQLGVGAGWQEPGWDAEFDLVWTMPDVAHETVPALPGFTSTSSGGSTTLTPLLIAPRVTAYRHVVNARVGGSVVLSERMTLHVGAFTDYSPIADSALYNTIDFYGLSGGIMFRRGDTGLILGTSATWGDERISLYNPATTLVQPGDISVFSMDVLIGTVSKF